jgi:site-specific DNA-methyltransferase (adenine-specific)
MGGGTTLIASYLTNRKGIGVEIDRGYCELAIKRLKEEAHIAQSTLDFEETEGLQTQISE